MGKLILLVEDDASITDVYKIVLKEAGFEVENFVFGRDAIERIKKADKVKPDLVLLDYILPDVNGLEVLKEIKRFDYMKNVPVFIVTNYSSKKLEEQVEKYGAERYIIKTSLTPKELLEIIVKKTGD